jgi:hypothetical protein
MGEHDEATGLALVKATTPPASKATTKNSNEQANTKMTVLAALDASCCWIGWYGTLGNVVLLRHRTEMSWP